MTFDDYTSQPTAFDWLDGTSVADTFNNFALGEPNNNQPPEECGVFFTNDGFWKSERCESRHYVCQKETG